MATLFMIFLVSLIASVTGAVILIKVGGWLAILSAVLILMYFFASASMVAIVMLTEAVSRKKDKKGDVQQ